MKKFFFILVLYFSFSNNIVFAQTETTYIISTQGEFKKIKTPTDSSFVEVSNTGNFLAYYWLPDSLACTYDCIDPSNIDMHGVWVLPHGLEDDLLVFFSPQIYGINTEGQKLFPFVPLKSLNDLEDFSLLEAYKSTLEILAIYYIE